MGDDVTFHIRKGMDSFCDNYHRQGSTNIHLDTAKEIINKLCESPDFKARLCILKDRCVNEKRVMKKVEELESALAKKVTKALADDKYNEIRRLLDPEAYQTDS